MGAALAAWLKFGDNADYWFAYYGGKPPDVRGKEVYIVDFSYDRETMLKMKAQAKSLLVLDHHETAKADMAGLDFCTFDMTKSGAMLAWEHFHPGQVANEMFFHIQDYDLWIFECEKTKPFSRALRSYDMDIKTWASLWNGFEKVKGFYDSFVAEGRVLQRNHEKQLNELVKMTKRPMTLMGITGLGANLPGMYASDGGELMAKECGTFGFTYFYHAKGDIKCSLRSTNADKCNVRKIAESFGGGGHDKAAGLVLTQEQINSAFNN